MLSDEVHDVRKILQEQVAKLAVIERDYQNLLLKQQGQAEHIMILEGTLNSYYRRGLFEGMSIAEFTAELNAQDPVGCIQTIIDGIREKGEFTMNDMVPTLRTLATAVQDLRAMKDKQNAEDSEEDSEVDNEEDVKAEEPRPAFSITGKPLS